MNGKQLKNSVSGGEQILLEPQPVVDSPPNASGTIGMQLEIWSHPILASPFVWNANGKKDGLWSNCSEMRVVLYTAGGSRQMMSVPTISYHY